MMIKEGEIFQVPYNGNPYILVGKLDYKRKKKSSYKQIHTYMNT